MIGDCRPKVSLGRNGSLRAFRTSLLSSWDSYQTVPLPAGLLIQLGTPDDVYLVIFLEQEPNTHHMSWPRLMTSVSARDLLWRAHIIEGRIISGQSIVFGMFHVMVDFSRSQKRFGRDYQPVQAKSPQDALPLYYVCFSKTQLACGRMGGDIASRPRANHEYIIGICHFAISFIKTLLFLLRWMAGVSRRSASHKFHSFQPHAFFAHIFHMVVVRLVPISSLPR